MKKLIVATNLTDLHKGPSFLEELLTQVFNGDELELLETQEKWCRVRSADGHEGWAYRAYLAEEEAPPSTHITRFGIAPLDSPHDYQITPEEGMKKKLGLLVMGTRVRVVEKGPKTWLRIAPYGQMMRHGWNTELMLRELSTLPLSPQEARKDILFTARGMTGVYYLWGGNTGWGTDCSGLVMLTHRLAGYSIRRDAWMQHHDAKKVDTAQEGDLFFFWNDARTKISHVGICTGGWNMIHSSRARNGVYEEDIQKNPNLMSSYAGAGTFLP